MLKAVAAALLLTIVTIDATVAQRIPSSAMPGRERQQLFDPLSPPVPRIELRDGRPAPVYEIGRKKPRPAKRKQCRGGKRC